MVHVCLSTQAARLFVAILTQHVSMVAVSPNVFVGNHALWPVEAQECVKKMVSAQLIFKHPSALKVAKRFAAPLQLRAFWGNAFPILLERAPWRPKFVLTAQALGVQAPIVNLLLVQAEEEYVLRKSRLALMVRLLVATRKMAAPSNLVPQEEE